MAVVVINILCRKVVFSSESQCKGSVMSLPLESVGLSRKDETIGWFSVSSLQCLDSVDWVKGGLSSSENLYQLSQMVLFGYRCGIKGLTS